MRISDWSSDVCSSDLVGQHHIGNRAQRRAGGGAIQRAAQQADAALQFQLVGPAPGPVEPVLDIARRRKLALQAGGQLGGEIGRASCRERVGTLVEILGGAGYIKQKKVKKGSTH